MIFNEKLKLSVENNLLKASHICLTNGQKQTSLSANAAASATTFTVLHYNGLADNDFLLLGNWGELTAEIVQIKGTPNTTVTLEAGMVYDHYADTPVTVIPYNQVEFYRATTLTGSKTALGGAGSKINIIPSRFDTFYADNTNSTGYVFFRFYCSEATRADYSEYSDGVSYEGTDYNSVENVLAEACSIAGVKVGDTNAEEDQLIRDINEAQAQITSKHNWSFELVSNETSITSAQDTTKYALSGLTYALKYPDSKQGIFNIKFASHPLDYIDFNEYEKLFEDTAQSGATSGAAIGATTLTLDDSYEFAEDGTVYSGANTITYTANAQSTGVLSGIPASGTGSITATITAGDQVWQGIQAGEPTKYSVFNGYIYVDVPIDSDNAGKKIKVKYLKKLSRLTNFASNVEIPFFEALSHYVAYKILRRKKDNDNATIERTEFENIVSANKQAYMLQDMDIQTYYEF